MTKKETLTKLEAVTILEPGEKKPKIVARLEVTYCWDSYFDDWNLTEDSERLTEVIRCYFLGRVTIKNPDLSEMSGAMRQSTCTGYSTNEKHD